MTDHLARSALVLQGGGALGAYELGAARALYEDGTFAPDVIAGVSIGAITAVLLARPKQGFKPLEALEAFWQEVAVPGLVLPPPVRQYASQIDGVWVTEPRCAVAVAIALRESLIALAAARLAGEGQQTKMELVYQYLTGPRFRHRIEAVVERFGDMQADLDRERKTMMRLWAKREEQIRGVVESTAGLYGDLQGIAGRTLLEIDGLELPLLDGPAADAAE